MTYYYPEYSYIKSCIKFINYSKNIKFSVIKFCHPHKKILFKLIKIALAKNPQILYEEEIPPLHPDQKINKSYIPKCAHSFQHSTTIQHQ